MANDINTVISYLNDLLAIHSCEDVAVNGIQIEGKRNNVRKVATAVTASRYAIEKAIEYDADLLIVHHGLFLKGAVSSLTGSLGHKVRRAVEHGLNIAAYHLPLDAHPQYGNAWSLPLDMGWKEITPFCQYKGGVHLGVTATVCPPNGIEGSNLYSQLKEYWGSRFSPEFSVFMERKIQRIAFIPGQGHKFIHEAIQTGADCFITGTVDEPIWSIAHEAPIAFFCFGHHATERKGVQNVGELLAYTYGVQHIFIDENNPF